jgi:hypothetical protein
MQDMTYNIKTPFLYGKPPEICRDLTNEELSLASLTKHEYISLFMRIIENDVNSKGLLLRLATFDDIIPVSEFIKKRYRIDLADEVSPYDIFRFIEFGHGLIVSNKDRVILGCLFEIGYDTIESTSYSVRLGIDESLNGMNIGQLLTQYSSLIAMRRGSKVKRGIIDFDNSANLYIQLNHVGWIVESFYYHIPELGDCYNVCLPLTIEGMLYNKIDHKRLIDYLKGKKDGVDYKCIKYNDIELVLETYRETDFKIVAMMKPGVVFDVFTLVALPAHVIGLNI